MEMTTNYSGDIFIHKKKAAAMLGGGLSKMNVSTLVLLLDSVFDSDSWVAFHWERLNPRNFMGIHFFGNFKCELGERNITSENYSLVF